MPLWNKMFSQNSNSPMMEHLMFFHDHSMLLISSIMSITMVMLMKCIKNTKFNQFLSESHETEMFWTSAPALMLIFIAIPSLKTLYMMEENMATIITIKTMGMQWLWAYEYSNILMKKNISCSIIPSNKMRTETTSKSLVIPNMTPTRMLISSKDVLHSWTIPSLGTKLDAMPGRINQTLILIKRPSIMIGQCSEICGAGHSFMPIYVESPNMKNFLL